jgi:NAD(P)-dependent dehydrogenase (short-subunit alcohol dehydrogenase family)
MGRAAAIAYAREGADVAINYLPDEEPDAKEVIALIEKEGRKGVALPGDLRDAAFCEKLVDDAQRRLAVSTSSSTTQDGSSRRSRSTTSPPKPSTRR